MPAQKGDASVASQGTPFASVRYVASAVGADSFKFKASDGNSDSNEVTVTTDNVPAVNDPPQCSGPFGVLEVEIGDPPSFAGSCFDEEGQDLTITITQQPQKGTAEVVTEGFPPLVSVRYVASAVGADSFKFKASDGNSDSNEVTVTTDNVPAVNDPPQCSGPFGVLEVEIGDPPSFAGSCFDEEGQDLTITITQQPQKGTAEVVTEGFPPLVSVRYVASAVGADSFKFKASDGNSDSNEVTVVTDNLPAVNDPPVCGGLQEVRVEVGEPGSGVPCSDAEGDILTLTIMQQPQKGTLEIVDQATRHPSLRYTATSVGRDSFSYKANDGNSDSNEATTTTQNVDTTAPQTTIDAGPDGVTRDPTPTFEFSASQPGSTFECRLDHGPWAPCASPNTFTPLTDGPHEFEVRATDPAGNQDGTPASRSFTVDTIVPQTTIDSGPEGVTRDPTPTFEFFASEPGSTFECRLDHGPWAPCTSPNTLAKLRDGRHKFEVRATDPAGNQDNSPARRSFQVHTHRGHPQPRPKCQHHHHWPCKKTQLGAGWHALSATGTGVGGTSRDIRGRRNGVPAGVSN